MKILDSYRTDKGILHIAFEVHNITILCYMWCFNSDNPKSLLYDLMDCRKCLCNKDEQELRLMIGSDIYYRETDIKKIIDSILTFKR